MANSDTSERLGESFYDAMFFQHRQLNGESVLDYLSGSADCCGFYVRGCNNDKCRQQGLPLTAMKSMVGVEYVKIPCEPV